MRGCVESNADMYLKPEKSTNIYSEGVWSSLGTTHGQLADTRTTVRLAYLYPSTNKIPARICHPPRSRIYIYREGRRGNHRRVQRTPSGGSDGHRNRRTTRPAGRPLQSSETAAQWTCSAVWGCAWICRVVRGGAALVVCPQSYGVVVLWRCSPIVFWSYISCSRSGSINRIFYV